MVRPPSLFPWVSFGLILAVQILLSYFNVPEPAKWGLGAFLALLAAVPALGFSPSGATGLWEWSGRQLRFKAALPWWVLAAGVGVFLRFYRLTSLSAWPMPDEGNYAFGSYELAEKGRRNPWFRATLFWNPAFGKKSSWRWPTTQPPRQGRPPVLGDRIPP